MLRGALNLALRFVLLWLQSAQRPELNQALQKSLKEWLTQMQVDGLAPNTQRFALAAQRQAIPVAVNHGFIQLGWGTNAVRMVSSFTSATGNIATRIARNKFQTNQLLAEARLPVPRAVQVTTREEAQKATALLGWPVVIKPSDQDQGIGVVPDIHDFVSLHQAFDAAVKYSPQVVIIEKHVEGNDYRLLVVGGKLLVATQRIPAGIVGDGLCSVAQLLEQVNTDSRRGTDKRSLLIRIELDQEARTCLARQNLEVASIPESGRFIPLRRTANISTGGTAVDVTANIHPDNRALAERAARIIGLDIAGVDLLCPDITHSWREVGGAICEVNAQPGFRVHWLADPSRDINGEVVSWLFRDKSARIPIAAITGTNGKSTVSRMLHHIWMAAGKVAGVSTTQGVWIGNELITNQNLSGQPGAKLLLNDSAVEVAIIEMPRKGLIRFGHPCDRYQVAALINVQDDHIGSDGIDSLEAMASLKAEVLTRASQAIVVNAEDPLCLSMRLTATAPRHILVARDEQHPAVRAHLAQNSEAVFVQVQQGKPWIVQAQGATHTMLMPLHDVPASMNGLFRFNEINALFATALAWAQSVEPDCIRQGLSTFHNSFDHNPGRHNFIKGFPFEILLDYGHNPVGMRELCEIASQIEVSGQRVLVSLIGHRHRHHLEQEVPWWANTFDRIYLSQDESYFRQNAHGFGSDDPLGTMLRCADNLLRPLLRSNQTLRLIRNDQEALREGLSSCKAGDLLVLLTGPWDALPLLKASALQLDASQKI